MTGLSGLPSWEELYKNDKIEGLPWFWPTLDPDLEAALTRHGIRSGRVLDEGTGPGTQAVALAERGFIVTAADLSAAAIEYASRAAQRRAVNVTFVQDDVLTSRLSGPFDAVFDRGCLHVLPPERRADYVKTICRLLVPSGWLLLKTLSHLQPGTEGPFRFAPDEVRRLFDGAFDVVDLNETVYQGQFNPWPKALFCSLRKRG